jgi:hypothetical protein
MEHKEMLEEHLYILHRTPSQLCRQTFIPPGHIFFRRGGIHGVLLLGPLADQLP